MVILVESEVKFRLPIGQVEDHSKIGVPEFFEMPFIRYIHQILIENKRKHKLTSIYTPIYEFIYTIQFIQEITLWILAFQHTTINSAIDYIALE